MKIHVNMLYILMAYMMHFSQVGVAEGEIIMSLLALLAKR